MKNKLKTVRVFFSTVGKPQFPLKWSEEQTEDT